MSIADGSTIEWHPQAGLLPADEQALRDIQATILRPAGRSHGAAVFLRFLDARPARRWIRSLAPRLTSMAAQLAESATAPAPREDGYGDGAPAADGRAAGDGVGDGGRPARRAVLTLALSAAGYGALDLPEASLPAGPGGPSPRDPFRAGMAEAALADPPPASWEAHLRAPHAVVRILADGADAVEQAVAGLLSERIEGVSVLGIERTALLRNGRGQAIEHFGYVDGRSQPRFFSYDVNRDQERNVATYWSAAPPLDWVLCRDPLSGTGRGSYLVVRKLEQHVRAFHRARRELAARLGCSVEEAGALLVGRDEAGRSLEQDGTDTPYVSDNGFLYEGACPVTAHTRLMNDRSGRTAYPLARRGMPYGHRSVHPDDVRRPKDCPNEGVGLLFMANTSDIAGQFEALQRRANGAGGQPFDPIIGQAATVPSQAWTHPDGTSARAAVGGYVTMRGGEYFFLPSLSGLASL